MDHKALYEDLATEAMTLHYRYFAPARRLQETVELCLKKATSLVLDVGCGDGILLAALRDRLDLSDAQFFGVDLAEGRLRRARQQVSARLSCADAVILPFKTGFFDLCICAEVLEHLPNPDVALAELYRVTRSGGRLILAVPVVGWSRWVESKVTGQIRFLNEMEHLREYAPVKLKRCVLVRDLMSGLAGLGWHITHQRGVYFYPHRGERLWNVLLGRSPLNRLATWLDHRLGSVPGLAGWGRYLLLECLKE